MSQESLTSKPKLLPCPFCGQAATISNASNDPAWWIVECNGLHCRVVPLTQAKGLDDAIDQWNKRAPEAQPPQEATGGHSSGWLIEGAWSAVDRPEYWAGSSIWSADAYKALRFATRKSAQQAADLMCAGMNVRIACHEFAEDEE